MTFWNKLRDFVPQSNTPFYFEKMDKERENIFKNKKKGGLVKAVKVKKQKKKKVKKNK